MRAQVHRSDKKTFQCKILDTGERVTAYGLGKLLKGKNSILTGDYVELKAIEDGHQIIGVEERKSEIFRMITRGKKKKVFAANCDLLAIVTSMSRPTYKQGIIDRFLLRAVQWNIEAIVIFNKMDEYEEDEKEYDIVFESDRLKDLHVESFEISAKYEKNYQNRFLPRGFCDFKRKIKGKTTICLGQSGVGKSNSINALTQGKFNLKIHKMGQGGKGTHTTTWSEIIDFDDFSIIDSPGVRSFSLEDLTKGDIDEGFPDLKELMAQCQFNNCTHEKNSKGCAFSTLPPHEYRTKLVLSRLKSFHKIKSEVSKNLPWARPLS